jgi:hypothetical protein
MKIRATVCIATVSMGLALVASFFMKKKGGRDCEMQGSAV